MLLYEERRYDESTPQVRALERALKRSSEGQRLNKLIRENNVDGFLPRSVGAYMNAAEGLASEAEVALRKASKYTDDAAGGKLSAPVSGAKRKHQQTASLYTQKCPGCKSYDHVYQECNYRLTSYFNSDPSVEFAQSSVGNRYYKKCGGGTSKSATWILSCTKTIEERVCSESGFAGRSFLRCRVNPLVENGLNL